MKDLLFFVCFILIFLLGFSITSWALITTNDQVTWDNDANATQKYYVTGGGSGLWSWSLLRNVTNYGIWKIFGQVDPIGKRRFLIELFIPFLFFRWYRCIFSCSICISYIICCCFQCTSFKCTCCFIQV